MRSVQPEVPYRWQKTSHPSGQTVSSATAVSSRKWKMEIIEKVATKHDDAGTAIVTAPGLTFTVQPGICIPDLGGVRGKDRPAVA